MARKAKLTVEQIVHAAVAVLDEKGLTFLTIRNLATRLGVSPMSLYNHVSGKDELKSRVAEWVAREIHVPTLNAGWRISLRQRSVSIYEMISRHPWASSLLESQKDFGPVRLTLLNASLACLRHADFSIFAAARVLLLLDSYTYGFAFQKSNWESSASPSETAQNLFPEGNALELPALVELMESLMVDAEAFRDLPLEFDVGLDLTLDAAEHLRTLP